VSAAVVVVGAVVGIKLEIVELDVVDVVVMIYLPANADF
jgi:hypothetical protein